MAFKKVILKISIGFVVFLLILTFFSQTILDMGIPSIEIIGSASSGLIQYTTTLNGTVDYSKKKLVYSPVNGNIELLVKKGERIIDGQPLFMVKSDIITQMEQPSDSYIVTAELDEKEGVITDIKFNINNSNYIYKDNAVLEIGIVNDVYIAEIITLEINKNIKIDTQARIILSETVCNGIVENIASENGMEIITIGFESEIDVAGQKPSVVIGESPKLFDCVLPNSAVMKGTDNISFIYMVEARKRQLGYDYYVVKRKVEVLDQDERNTALVPLYPNKNIIVSSDMPIYEGSRVKIMNGSDFDAIR